MGLRVQCVGTPCVRNAALLRKRSAVHHHITTSPHHHIPTSAQGFTLIELLIVLSLIVILASMGMAQYHSSVVYAKEATLHEDLFRMRDAIDQYYADKGTYPGTL